SAQTNSCRYWGTVWDDDTVRSWSCTSTGFYSLKVPEENNPQDRFSSNGEKASDKLSVQIKKECDDKGQGPLSGYYVYITHPDPNLQPTDRADLFSSDYQDRVLAQNNNLGWTADQISKLEDLGKRRTMTA